MLTVNQLSLGLLIALLTACSGEDGSSATDEKHDHAWKTQTDALDKAREVEGLLDDAASKHLKADE